MHLAEMLLDSDEAGLALGIPDLDEAVLAAKRSALAMLGELKATRERRGLSLADMMRLTGMSRAAISRLENDQAPNPTVRTVSRYAEALGLEFRFDFRPRKGA